MYATTSIDLPCLDGLFPRPSSLLFGIGLFDAFLDFFSERLLSFLLGPNALVNELRFPPPIELLDFLVLFLFDRLCSKFNNVSKYLKLYLSLNMYIILFFE